MAHNDGSLSYHLYEQLLEFVGTPNIVRLRRLFFNTMDTILSSKNHSAICSGSKAEGLNMPGSDLDVMLINKREVVHNDISNISTGTWGLYLDTETTSAGFAQIRVKVDSNDNLSRCSTRTEHGPVLDNRMFRGHRMLLNSPSSKYRYYALSFMETWFPTHGPCTSTMDGKYDFLSGLQCKSWPDIASSWIERPKEWPPTNLIENILNEKVILAPIGSKFGSAIDNPNEWRLSFSVAEIMLVRSFNHTQLTCYAMLKLMVKEVIDANPTTEKLLCSYFIKTILFWLIEETGYSVWQPHKLIQCFRMCLKRLIYFVENGECPNYFIPQNNMFEGKICGSAQKKLSRMLENLYYDGINALLRSKTLSKYLQSVYESGMPSKGLTVSIQPKEVDKAFYPLLHHLHKLLIFGTDNRPNFYNAFCHIMNEKRSKLAKSLYILYFVHMCHYACQQCQYDINSSNKHLYIIFRKFLRLFVIGTYSDAVTGWLWLALFFYHQHQYKNVLMITDFVSSSCSTREIQLICEELMPKSSNCHSSFLKRYRYACFKSEAIIIKEKTFFHKIDLQIVLPGLPHMILPGTPAVFANFLEFMCFQHTGHIDKRRRALRSLQRRVEDVKHISFFFAMDMLCLIKASELANHKVPPYFRRMFAVFVAKYLAVPSNRELFTQTQNIFAKMNL